MNTYADKTNKKENPSFSVAEPQKQNNSKSIFQLVDNRPEAVAQRKLQEMANSSSQVKQMIASHNMSNNQPNKQHIEQQNTGIIQRKKDKAVYDFGDKGDGKTSTKVIDQKEGGRGLFKYQYKDDGNVIDTFNGTNIADSNIANGTIYQGISTPNITVKVASHDLKKQYGNTPALSTNIIANGTRAQHFAHADAAHGIDRTDKYTWHHKQEVGKMELIDMNTHGAMWHYGGIAGWGASLHSGDSSEDD